MLLRFVIKNIFSFGEQREFTTIPNNRLGSLKHHIYNECDFDYLKLASIYGANGAGKSNIVKSLFLLQRMVTNEQIPYYLSNSRFKFNSEDDSKDQLFAVEFIQDDIAFYYGVILNERRVAQEELYISGLGKKEDELIFERKTDIDNNTTIQFSDEFEQDERSQLLKSILLDEFIKPNELSIKILSNRDNRFLYKIKPAYRWFERTLQIITTDSKYTALPHKVDIDTNFKEYVSQMMCSLNIGISEIKTEKKSLDDFFGFENKKEIDRIKKELDSSNSGTMTMGNNQGDEFVIVKEKDNIFVKYLKVGHIGGKNKKAFFDLSDESDGTTRVLDYIPALRNIIFEKRVFVIDEIERSIHPLLIKELVEKFSLDEKTKGQLIFTTHESNLLDQNIFRKDEIWFVEKNQNGSSDLYSLNDFKEHKTIDIQKGYLSGRYGSIPFLGNLKDLNWHNNDTDE